MHKRFTMRKSTPLFRSLLCLLFLFLVYSQTFGQGYISAKTQGMEPNEGFFKYYWDKNQGKIWLEIDRFGSEFLYVNSLTAGVGSNDIGLDRNQLGNERVVRFERIGPKVLLKQVNYDYRAVSDNLDERNSVEEAFAQSVLWGFKVEAEQGDRVLVDLTPFLLRDAHGVSRRLKNAKQGSYKLDAKRSAIYLRRTRNFPENSEFEATLTYGGEPLGDWIRSVAPTANAITVRQHHSFVKLPDESYNPRVFDPRSGFNALMYRDYATPISQPLVKRFIVRHRLEKKNPSVAISEPVEPIIYYLDRGVPEPIRSALMEGASWWDQAFESAGYKGAFQVKILPEDADPMDLRYNVINWVHRSTRGWSYGSSVIDPRTGEIIKGHVSLGSLRVRQDYLIAQGLIDAYKNGKTPDPRLEKMALARIRQLSAHEVGHTLGLAHNFSSSVNDRASVMDYPHPLIQMDDDGKVNFSKAYDIGIGAWDKRTILYGYQDFPDGTNESEALGKILKENIEMGLQYISDRDARPVFGAHPTAHLWDNGASAVEELQRITNLRSKALESFGENNIPEGQPMATLENVLVPIYLMHRYQVEAVSKLLGGVNYTYAVKGDGQVTNQIVDASTQKAALKALLSTLAPDFLALPDHVIKAIPPQPMGYRRGRELFKVHTGLTFDPIGAAESSVQHSINFLLNPQRLTRIVEQHARQSGQLSLYQYLEEILKSVRVNRDGSALEQEISRMTEKMIVQRLLRLAGDKSIMQQVSAVSLLKINELEKLSKQMEGFEENPLQAAHYSYLLHEINQFRREPSDYKLPKSPSMPDGSPIGCGGHF